MKNHVKIMPLISALLFVSSFLFSAPQGEKIKCPPKVKVHVAEVKGESFREFTYFTSEIVPARSSASELKALVNGKIKDVMFQTGDEVKNGDLLFTLEAAVFKKEVKDAEAVVNLWKKNLQQRKNWKIKSEKAEKQAEGKLKEVSEKLAVAKQKLDNCSVKSPMDGKIVMLTAAAGMKVTAGSIMAVVVNDSMMKLAIAGDEIANLTDKEKVFVKFADTASGMTGEVQLSAPNQADILLDNRDKKLKTGFKATCKVLKKEYSDVIVIREEHVFRDLSGPYTYVAKNNRAARVELKLGVVEEGKAMVLAGLDKGMQLIVDNLGCLYKGKRIEIVPEIGGKPESTVLAAVEPTKEEVILPAVASEGGKPAKYKIGLNFSYNYITGEGFSGLYGRAVGPGVEFAYQVAPKIDIWLGASFSSKQKNFDLVVDGTTKYTMIPIAVGMKYYLLQKEKLSAFVGGGLNYIIFKDTNPINETKENVFGFNVLGGGNYKLSKKVYAQMMLRFNSAKKKLALVPEPEFPLDLSGFELTIGAFYTF